MAFSPSDFINMTSLLIQLGKDAANLPAHGRQKYRNSVDETYRLFDTALSLMINRLESILVITEDKQENFFEELSSLHNFDEWTNIEREVNLCRSLRMLQREMTSFWDNLRSKLSLRNTGGVEDKIKDVLEGERSFAELIGSSLDTLAKMKGNASITYTKAREAVENKLDELKETRRKLISSEISFYEII